MRLIGYDLSDGEIAEIWTCQDAEGQAKAEKAMRVRNLVVEPDMIDLRLARLDLELRACAQLLENGVRG